MFGSSLWLTVALLAAAAARSAPTATAGPPPTDDAVLAAQGALTYVYLCAECHGGSGEGKLAKHAPRLAGKSPDTLVRQLLQLKSDPPAAQGAVHAKAFAQLDREAIEGVALYLSTLAPPPEFTG